MRCAGLNGRIKGEFIIEEMSRVETEPKTDNLGALLSQPANSLLRQITTEREGSPVTFLLHLFM